MKKYTKKEAVNRITLTAKSYKEKLAGKKFKIIYQENQNTKECIVIFLPRHFKHLTGVISSLSATNFYKVCIDNKLSLDSFNFDRQGHSHMKLAVLPRLPDLLYNPCWIGRSINNDIYINADYFVGDTKCVLSLGIRENEKYDFPITLKNQSIKENVHKEFRVVKVMMQLLSDNNDWQEIYTYENIDK